MSITITGRHMTVTTALRRYLEERSERLKRYGVELDGCQFVLSVEKYRHAAEGVVTVKGRIVQGKVSTQEMYGSIDRLMEKLERQLLKNKEKLVGRKLRTRSLSGARRRAASPPAIMSQLDVMRVPAPVLTLEEALTQLRTRRIQFLLFRNATAGHLQAVQWTDGGQIELIDAGSSSSME